MPACAASRTILKLVRPTPEAAVLMRFFPSPFRERNRGLLGNILNRLGQIA
jgi:hypothetical protein